MPIFGGGGCPALGPNVNPRINKPLVDVDRGVSPFSGWIQLTFGGNTRMMGRVY